MSILIWCKTREKTVSEAQEIRKNSFFSLASTSSRLLANSILLIIINNMYGKELAGQLATANIIAGIFIAFSDFGLDLLLTTEIARERIKANELFNSLLPVKMLLIFISFIAVWVMAFAINFSFGLKIILLIFSFYMITSIAVNYFTALFRGYEKYNVDAKITLISNLFLLISVVLLSILGYSILYIAAAYMLSKCLAAILYISNIYKYDKSFTIKFHLSAIKTIRGKVSIFGTNMVFQNLLAQMDTLFIQFWIGDSAVGIYQAAARIYAMPLVLLDVLFNAFVPPLVRFYNQDKDKWRRLGYVLNKTLIYISLPFALLLIVYPEQIIHIIYFNKDFSESINVLRLFGILLLIRSVSDTSGTMITTSGNQHSRMRVTIVSTVVAIPLFWYYVSRFQVIGAIQAQLIINSLVGAAFISLTFQTTKKWFYDKELIMTVLFSIICFTLLWHFRSTTLFFLFPIFAVAYINFIYYFGYSKEEKEIIIPDKSYFKNILRNIKNNGM